VDAQVLEKRLHADAEIFIVAVDGPPDDGLASSTLGLRMPARMGAIPWSRRTAMVRAAERDVTGGGPARAWRRDLAAQLPQVISGLAGGVVLLSGHGVNLGGQVRDGNAAGAARLGPEPHEGQYGSVVCSDRYRQRAWHALAPWVPAGFEAAGFRK
jgi:hypothetical protein